MDDTLLLGGASLIIAEHFKEVLDQYILASIGLINHIKLHIYSWNISNPLQKYLGLLGFHHVASSKYFKYLRIPIYVKSHSSQVWLGIIVKFKCNIQHYNTGD